MSAARRWLLGLGTVAVGIAVLRGYEDLPRVVEPGGPGRAPSDAVVLFDGTDVSPWTREDGSPTGCEARDGAMLCATGAGNAVSRERFGSAQIHIEFAVPHMPLQHGQARGNSGVYVQGRHEIQVLDSFGNETYPTGQCGALYGQAPPLVNACRAPDEWQSYDILFRAARCDEGGAVVRNAVLTVLQNGVLIHDGLEVESSACGDGPLLLQDHSYPGAPDTEMRFRNVWVRRLE